MEPITFIQTMISRTGLTPKSSIAIELQVQFWTLWSMVVIDKLHVTKLASAEHVARRILQQLEAVRKNSRSPDYTGLDAYMSHCVDATESLCRTSGLDKHIASHMKDEAQILKSQRQAREELDSDQKRKAKGNG